MGAIARQVLQVKRKNSTRCGCPEARLTVVGSVASRSGPREVATACTSTLTTVAGTEVMDSGVTVAGMDSTAGGAAGTLVVAEAQADANSTATRLTVQKKKRGLIGFLLFIMT